MTDECARPNPDTAINLTEQSLTDEDRRAMHPSAGHEPELQELQDNGKHPGDYTGNPRFELIADVEAGEAYSFDHIGVWLDKKTGRYVWDHDSHCSCYGDYEDGTAETLTDLASDFSGFESHVRDSYAFGYGGDEKQGLKADFIAKVKRETGIVR